MCPRQKKKNKKPDLGAWTVLIFFLPKFDQLSFLMSLHNKIFHIEKLQDCSVYSSLHPHIFLYFFWRFEIWIFWCLSYQAPGRPGAISIFRVVGRIHGFFFLSGWAQELHTLACFSLRFNNDQNKADQLQLRGSVESGANQSRCKRPQNNWNGCLEITCHK
jgi:hypothetical protein